MDIESHLLLISDKEQNNVEAQASMKYIYETFRDFVYNVTLKKIHFNLNKEETALIIMSNVFMYVWNNPLAWEFNPSIHKTQDGGYKSYLSVIANYKFLEELGKSCDSRENEKNSIDEDDSEWKWSLLDEEYDFLDEELSKNKNLIDECLVQFSEKKQDIIRMYFLFYEDGKNTDSQNIKLLEKMFETTWQNIRQTISRAKKDIKKEIQNKTINK